MYTYLYLNSHASLTTLGPYQLIRASWPAGRSATLLLAAPALENATIYCTGAPGALRMAARVRSVPQARSKELFDPLRGAPGRSKELLKPPLGAPGRSRQLRRPLLGAPGTLEVAAPAPTQCPRCVRNASSSPYSEPQRHSSLLLCHRAFEEAFKEAVQRSGSATLSPVTLHSAALYTVHGYARVHTSIYIYIYIYIYDTCLWTPNRI